LDTNGKSGLIAAKLDQPETPMFWSRLSGGHPYNTGGTGDTLGTGQSNTALMLANPRAKDQIIKYLTKPLNGYSDWYMGSFREMELLWLRRMEVGNMTNKTYWCSTEVTWEMAGCLDFGMGNGYYRRKNNEYYGRPIRSFDDSSIPTGVEVTKTILNTTEITFTSPAPVSVKNGVLSFNMKSSLPWKDTSTIIITSVLGSTNTGVTAIKPKYLMGYNPSNPNWQQVVVPMYKFAGEGKSTLDKFRFNFKFEWPNGIDIGLDDIRFEHTIMEDIILKERMTVTDYRFEELPDSERTLFTTLQPYIEGTVELYINGQKQALGVDYFEEDDKIRIAYVLNEQCSLMINYYIWKS
jgi:hypothetical protein